MQLIENPLFPTNTFAVRPCSEHKAWMEQWLDKVLSNSENGIVSSSECMAGAVSEEILFGRLSTDWAGIMSEYLEMNGVPLAYSEKFGERLHKFQNQWKQSPVHSIYSRWWIERSTRGGHDSAFSDMIMRLVQPTGWVYNPDVSYTGIRTRMKTELFMSLAMASQILTDTRTKFDSVPMISAAVSVTPTGFVGAEYFRLRSLQTLEASEQMPDTRQLLECCSLENGFCDFDVNAKIDDYLGVRKRIERDVAVFSPLVTMYALYIAEMTLQDQTIVNAMKNRTRDFIRATPMYIPSLKMRDIDHPFGDGVTIYEIIAATILMRN